MIETFYDLFAGIGGFRLGLERNNLKCIGSCEIDKYARQIYIKNFGDTPEPDVRLLDCTRLPDFDILCAGFPCQPFSTAGNRRGFEDTRGTIFFEIARIAKEKKPPILFLENVKGLLYNDRGRTFAKIITTLAELGYDVEWQCINGRYFLPQRRNRVFIIGHLREKPTPKIFPIGDNHEPGKETPKQEGGRIAHCIDANYHYGLDNYAQRTIIVLLTHTKANIQNRVQMREDTWTLDTTPSKFGILEGSRMRMLTPLECERLQGFPDGWTEGVSDVQRYRCLGNAVMVPVIEYIGQYLIR